VFGVSVVIGAGIFTVTVSTFGNIHANLATAFSLNGIHWAATIISIGALAGVATVDRPCGNGIPDVQAGGDGQRRDALRLLPGIGRGHRPAADPSGSRPRIQGALRPGAADCVDRGMTVADGESHWAEMDPVRPVDGDRHRRLRVLRITAFGARSPTGRVGDDVLRPIEMSATKDQPRSRRPYTGRPDRGCRANSRDERRDWVIDARREALLT